MMTKRNIVTVLLLMLFPFLIGGSYVMGASKSKHKTFSKKYKEARLENVLQEIAKKTDYVLRYDPEDIDAERRVTINLKDASARAAYKKILGKEYVITVKKGVITLTRQPEPPTVYNVTALKESRIEEDSLMTIRIYEDTTYSISCRKVTKEVEKQDTGNKEEEEPAVSRKGHYIQGGIGLGYGTVGYKLTTEENTMTNGEKESAKTSGNFAGNLQVQYAYYFHENWGVTAGVGFSGYGSQGLLNVQKRWNGQDDSDTELYDHLALAKDWKEKQVVNMVDIPVGIQCQYPIKDKWRFYAGTGLRIGLPVQKTYRLQEGSVKHEGFYPQWNLLLSDGLEDRDFYTETVGKDFGKGKEKLSLGAVSVGVMADLGVMYELTKQLDLMVGAYFQMTCNDLKNGSVDMGWKQTRYEGELAYRNHEFMNAYSGMIASEYAGAVRPYQVGVKIGLSWHHAPKPKAVAPLFEQIQVCDTTITLTERADTIMKPVKPAAKEIQRLMKKSVIWFDVNSTIPKLQPADILDKIAAVLIENPEQRIIVSGHASKEGNAIKNRILSEKRAQAIANLLKEKGVQESQLQVEAHSSDIDYVVGEGEEHTISLDRRTEIIPIND